ncbi:baseplate J/gp47 family protein [Sideroxydans lithotrophicus]|uniref:Baseplate J family protein n=1 Tax=Sideroxydans lithotrophicus (strain ES-1) TaxID=580332 RepID=D5CUF1_SIDLE|nr:baseplate J/gp47 family protein [Sideroxydans lithotrophicus]ADE10486.1 Baseplate J family protein [Sideroxydans lithotrophicus ES-1]
MTFPTQDYRQVRDQILRDIANQNHAAYVGEDSDFYVRANASGNAVEGLYEHQKWIMRQVFADTADVDILEARHANPRGITRKAASFSTGTVLFSGVVGSAVPLGTEAKTVNGTAFVTTAGGVIGAGGTAVVAAKASLAGAAGNQIVDTALTLSAAPSGVQSQAAIVSMTGGTEIETPQALLARVLFDMQMPPMGGAPHDYFRWAMEVSGVTDAYVFTQRRVPNGVDVVVETSGGLPSAQLLADVLAYIETQRPACVDLITMAPTLVPVNIAGALALDGVTLVDATASITAVLQAYFATLDVGETVRKVKIEALITSIKGVVDVSLTSPNANVLILADSAHSELGTLGSIALT